LEKAKGRVDANPYACARQIACGASMHRRNIRRVRCFATHWNRLTDGLPDQSAPPARNHGRAGRTRRALAEPFFCFSMCRDAADTIAAKTNA
jgi:hypothetical protein